MFLIGETNTEKPSQACDSAVFRDHLDTSRHMRPVHQSMAVVNQESNGEISLHLDASKEIPRSRALKEVPTTSDGNETTVDLWI